MAREFNGKQKPEYAGNVRQSQLLFSFGIGYIIDSVRDTVMIVGVDDWDESDEWQNRKLLNNNLQAMTGVEYFLAPKTSNNVANTKSQDVLSYIFPQKLYYPIRKHIINALVIGTIGGYLAPLVACLQRRREKHFLRVQNRRREVIKDNNTRCALLRAGSICSYLANLYPTLDKDSRFCSS